MIHCVRGVSTGDVFCSISVCLLGWGYSRATLFSLPYKFQIAISYFHFLHFLFPFQEIIYASYVSVLPLQSCIADRMKQLC